MSGCTPGNAFRFSVGECGKVCGALTALPSLYAGREIVHVASGTYSASTTDYKNLRDKFRNKLHLNEARLQFP